MKNYVYEIILKRDGCVTTVKTQDELARYVQLNKANITSYRKKVVA